MKTQLLTLQRSILTSGVLIGSLFISSCTKTEIQPYEKEEMARISSFKIINTNQEIIGAIDNSNKTITVTLPANLYMTSLEPEVKVASGATLKQGTDTLITNMMDYFSNGRIIQYPLTATDGSSATYTLTIKSDQIPLNPQEVSTDLNNPIAYDQTFWYTRNDIYVLNTLSSYPYIATPESDLELAKASLVDKNGKEYAFKSISSATSPSVEKAYMLLNLNDIEGRVTGSGRDIKYNKVPAAGDYFIKLRYYSREVTLKNPIRIFYNN